MNDSLEVAVRELPAVRVAFLEYHAEGRAGEYGPDIGMMYRDVEGWLKHLGYKTDSLRRFGVPFSEGSRLRSYWCCVEAPDGLAEGKGKMQVRELAAGRYAVLSLHKDSETVGPAISRFYDEYAPAHGLVPDETRPLYEVYHPESMEYRIPVQ